MVNIIFLTEGGKTKGFGHVGRCVSIADALKENFREINVKMIVNADSSVMKLTAGFKDIVFIDWNKNISKIMGSLNEKDIIIVDSYEVSEISCRKIAEKSRVAVFIDDFNRIPYPENVFVVNGTINAEKIPYPKKNGQKYLTGIRFAYLRKEFWDTEKRNISPNIKNCLVSMGGSDIRNLTPKILDFLKKHDFNKTVFVTDAMSNIKEIEKRKDNSINIVYNPSAAQIKSHMMNCDAGIIAAGQTIFEAVSTGLPCITVQVADNQEMNVKFWQEKQLIIHAGNYNDQNLFDNIAENLISLENKSIRQRMAQTAENIIDGNGSLRIAKEIFKEYFKKSIILVPAEDRDAKDVFNLSNQRAVRENSYSPDPIIYSEHIKWYNNIIRSEKDILFLAKIDEKLAGQVKFSKEGGNFIVGISIDENFRGLGLGKIILQKGIENLKNIFSCKTKVIAFVKTGNLVSAKLFISLGFVEKEILTIKGAESYKFELELN